MGLSWQWSLKTGFTVQHVQWSIKLIRTADSLIGPTAKRQRWPKINFTLYDIMTGGLENKGILPTKSSFVI